MRRVLLALTVGSGLLAIRVLCGFVPLSGVFQELEPALVDTCTKVHVHAGTEDVAIDRASDLVFVSATDRRSRPRDNSADGIYAFPLDFPSSAARVSPADLRDFHPRGIGLWSDGDGTRLFAINHAVDGGESVEIFAVGDGGALEHLESVAFPAMTLPNDLVAVGPRHFYASNGRVEPSGVASALALALRLPLASLVYYDGVEGRRVARGLVYANGVNASPDRRSIYVSEVLARRVSVFDRDVRTGAVTKRKSIPLQTAPDNIDVDGDGHAWVAGHSRVFDFAAHGRDPAAVAPSRVIRVDIDTGTAVDVFVSVNGEINAASVGAVHREKLVAGAALDGHVMLCDLRD